MADDKCVNCGEKTEVNNETRECPTCFDSQVSDELDRADGSDMFADKDA